MLDVSNIQYVDYISMRELFKKIIELNPPTCTVTIIGRMFSGKSTLARLLENHIKDYYKTSFKSFWYTPESFNSLDKIDRIEVDLAVNSEDVNYIVLKILLLL